MSNIVSMDKFITKVNAQEITNPKPFEFDKITKEPKPTEDGIFSIKIFGPLHSNIRNEKWGYVNLGVRIVHPAALLIAERILPALKKIILRTQKYSLDNGKLVSDPENGRWGVSFFKEVLDNIDWNKVPNAQNKKIYITKLQNLKDDELFINKWVIIPAGFRDFNIRNGRVAYDEVNDLYDNLIQIIKGNSSQASMKFLVGSKDNNDVSKETVIQKMVLDIHEFLLKRLQGKKGLVRSSLIKKRTDFAARLVASSAPWIPIFGATYPWGALINLFAPYVIAKIEQDEEFKKKLFGANATYVSTEEYSNLFQYIFKNMKTVAQKQPDVKKKLIEILETVFNENSKDSSGGLQVVFGRDPQFAETNSFSSFPIIDTRDTYNIGVNSIYYNPLGGDSIQCKCIWELPIKEKRMNPKFTIRMNKIYQYTSFDEYYENYAKNS